MGNFGPNMGMDRNITQQQQAAAVLQQHMRNNYMNNQGSPFAGNNQNGQMPQANPNVAAIQRYQQMQTRQQMMNQMRAPNMMPANMKTTGMRFPQQPNIAPAQANFTQNNVQAQQQAQQMAQMQQTSGAKWHTPQQKQATHASNNLGMMGVSMSPPANNFINDSFKIPLRSPDTLRNQTVPTNGSTSFPIPLPNVNVTSSNPKTPSPSLQKDTQKEIDSIESLCNESVVDLLATIAKLDSNGVQVVPEGRNKATSPQVHSSTDMSMDPNSLGLNDKNNQPKDDPNEDWCAVCMGKLIFFCFILSAF
jgi:tripartite motif-containing protein 33